MSDTVDNNISDEILTHAEEYIKELLKNRRLAAPVRAQLEIQSYFLMFLIQDHEKMNQVYPFYREQKAKQQKTDKLFERIYGVIIPIIITGSLAFVAQFLYFWVVVVPKLVAK